MKEKAPDLPLSDIATRESFDYYRRREERTVYLYIIETLKDGKWKVIEKGKLQVEGDYFTQSEIDAVYAHYGNNSNYRIVVYDTILPDFTDKLLPNEIKAITSKIERFKEGIRIAEKEGFRFQSLNDPSSLEISKTTGLVLEQRPAELYGEICLYFKMKEEHYFLNLKPKELNSPEATKMILSKLKVALSELKSELLDLEHRLSTNNKRGYHSEVFSSIWHGSTAHDKDMVYLLEFRTGQPYFKKYELKEVTYYDSDTAREKEWFHAPIYLQHGEVKRMGFPVSNFGWLDDADLDGMREIDKGLLDFEEEINFQYRDFIQRIGDLKVQTDFVGDLFNGEKSHKEFVEWCEAWFKGDILSALNAIKILYGDANYLIDENRPDGVRINSPSKGDLNYLEDHQRLSNIWNVI